MFVTSAVALLVACAPSDYPAPPDTRVGRVVDVIHGVEIADDYRWLEDQDAPETRTWIAAQNAYAETVIGESPLRDRIRQRLTELIDVADVGSTRRAGDHEYFTMRRVGEPAPIIYRRPAADDQDADEPTVDGTYEVVLDPGERDRSHRTIFSMVDFSPEGDLMMYSVRDGGADEISVRIMDLETFHDLPDSLPNALYSGLGFTQDGTGFHYTYRSRLTGPRIRRHALGTDPSQDEEVWGEGYGPTTFVNMRMADDGRYRIFTAQHGWARHDVYLQDTRTGRGIEPLVVGERAHFDVEFHEGTLYLRTDLDAPLYRVLAVDPSRPGREHWTEVLAETDDVLQDIQFIDGQVYATYLDDVSDRIAVLDSDWNVTGEVSVPPHMSAGVSGGEEETIRLSLRGHLQSTISYSVDPQSGERAVVEEPDTPFDPAGYTVEQVWYTSRDGTRAPMYVMHREGIALDGTNPTLLNGYGGFNVAIKPGFSTRAAVWMEEGGVYAIATLRGGSEYGETWHRDGMLENKQNVFDDFIGAAEFLIDAGYTSPERLAITGGSNGGLLVASAMTQRPELFRAVLCTYPDLDMVRFHAFTETNNMPALLEYGDASKPEEFTFLRAYSPYQAVRDGERYPAVMLTTGDLDTRVPPLQARKMTARLQASSGSGLPVVLHYDEKGGHAAGRGRPVDLRIEDATRELAFLMQQLGMGS
jgi:prolyl oligopeptidase